MHNSRRAGLSPARQRFAVLWGGSAQPLRTLHPPLTQAPSKQIKASCTAAGHSERFALTDSTSSFARTSPWRQLPRDLTHRVTW